jgi:Zn finger protein HypA/HybF involved in hydrogenase expression
MKPEETWSDKYKYCITCHKTSSIHVMEGYCQKCFAKLEAEIERIYVDRSCLKCGDTFQSEGPGNRRCTKCHKKDPATRHRHRLNIN